MANTVEISDKSLRKLKAAAKRRGTQDVSEVLEDAIESYAEAQGADEQPIERGSPEWEDRLRSVQALAGTFSDEEAKEVRERIRDLWRPRPRARDEQPWD